MRGSQLRGLQSWRDRRPVNAPDLTARQNAFLTASEEAGDLRESAERKQLADMAAAQAAQAQALEAAEVAQNVRDDAAKRLARRTVIGLGGAFLLVLIAAALGSFAYIQSNRAKMDRLRAVNAKLDLRQAEQNLDLRERYFLARVAEGLIKDSRPVEAALIALEGMPDADEEGGDKSYVSEVSGALIMSLRHIREQRILLGHDVKVTNASWSPDGRRIVSATNDRTARIWDPDTGKEITQLRGHIGGVNMAAWSPDGWHIVTASDDNTARIRTVLKSTQDYVDLAKKRLPRCLTSEERRSIYKTAVSPLPAWCKCIKNGPIT